MRDKHTSMEVYLSFLDLYAANLSIFFQTKNLSGEKNAVFIVF